MKKFPHALLLLIFLLATTLMPALAHAEDLVVGVNMVNADKLSTEKQNAIFDEMKAAGVHVIRAGITPDDKGVDFAKRAFAQGIRIDWIVSLQYRSDAPSRPYQSDKFPEIWGGHPLSAADPDQFKTYFESLLTKLEAAGIIMAGFELGNEINTAGFNAEFPLPGEGKNLSLDDLYHDPEGQQIAKGFLQYLKILAVLKDIRDHSKLNQHTPIISAGLANNGPPGPVNSKIDGVSVNATIDFMRAKGLDQLVDAYGIHTYFPGGAQGSTEQIHAARQERLERDAVTRCGVVGSSNEKPCWITEWGSPNKDLSCPLDDSARTTLVRDVISIFRDLYKQRRLTGLIYFAWNTDPWAKQTDPLSIYRCGALTESGRLAVAPIQ